MHPAKLSFIQSISASVMCHHLSSRSTQGYLSSCVGTFMSSVVTSVQVENYQSYLKILPCLCHQGLNPSGSVSDIIFQSQSYVFICHLDLAMGIYHLWSGHWCHLMSDLYMLRCMAFLMDL